MDTSGKPGGFNRSARLGTFLDKVLSGFGLSHNLSGWKIVTRWPEIVGSKNAEHSQALRFSDDTLLVRVTDAVWRQELSLDADRILNEIHKQPGGKVVKKIHFVA
ncbi:MAG: DUF721 domain-containing protein [Candidatus Zixiibacteriota bacterium]